MHPSHWARVQSDTPAVIMAGSGETVTFSEMEAAANRGAQLMRKLGLKRGDVFALWSGNNPRFLEIAWAMNRTGLYMVPIAAKLRTQEASYIINDSDAKLLIVDATLPHAQELAGSLAALCPAIRHAFALRGALPSLERWEAACAAMPAQLIDDPALGQQMIYSSGTTGKPKGVQKPLREEPFDGPMALAKLLANRYNARSQTTFLVSAPLYHSGPIGMAMAEQSLGATLLLFETFDAETMLAAIERYQPERGQFVPTMFVRLLKLPCEVRRRYDISSLKVAIHSAAPCPIDVKHQMITWWGLILEEIYGGTENIGSTMISSAEWLHKPGSVGRPISGEIHICDDAGQELAPGQTGTIYFETSNAFAYHNDPIKTRSTQHPQKAEWATFGDIGHIDADGYLYLSDRKAFMVISGGINIYPQETENVLTMHPDVADVAAFGIPDPDLGERLIAVVQPSDWACVDEGLEAELIAFTREHLAGLKCPKAVFFERSLERDPAGKIAKRTLRERYITLFRDKQNSIAP
ncbi:MAG TPA: AMP-binding protein [Beijerinckia sp.]|jgi:acyl-CoA synthetase (AMP-forming)/AMP-acid ligase II|nr:AMP-binding protein [Beijerinckia sp.]